MRTWAGWLALGVAAVLGCEATSEAFYLDSDRNFDVRVRAYSQLGIMTAGLGADAPAASPVQAAIERHGCSASDPRTLPAASTAPAISAQNRNFYNPEFDAKLTDYTRARRRARRQWIAPDEFKFRFAWWGFYDGLYDYLNPEWADARRAIRTRRASPRSSASRASRRRATSIAATRSTTRTRTRATIYAQPEPHQRALHRLHQGPGLRPRRPAGHLLGRVGHHRAARRAEPVRPDARRAGLLPGRRRGAHPALDPALRRSSWSTTGSSSRAASSTPTWCPDPIDTTVPINPITVRRVARSIPDVPNPQGNLFIGPTQGSGGQPGPRCTRCVVDHLPENTWANTRWGARLRACCSATTRCRAGSSAPSTSSPCRSSAARRLRRSPARAKTTLVDDRGFRTPICLDDNGNRIPQRSTARQRRRRGPHAGGAHVRVEGAGRDLAESPARVGDRPRRHVVQRAAERHRPRGGGVLRRRARRSSRAST